MKKWILVGLLVAPAAWLAALPARSERPPAKVVHIEAGGAGYLGASIADLEKTAGVRVERVGEGSPAERAGLRKGDVIVRFAGEAVRSAAQFVRLVRETPPGRPVELELERDGTTRALTCELGRREGARASASEGALELDLSELGDLRGLGELQRFSWRDFGRGLHALELPGPGGGARLGLSYQAIGNQLARYFKLEADSGVLVTDVAAGGAAEQAGLEAGDVILSFDGQAVGEERDLRKAVRAAEAGRPLSVAVWRDGRKLELKATLAPPDSAVRRGRPL